MDKVRALQKPFTKALAQQVQRTLIDLSEEHDTMQLPSGWNCTPFTILQQDDCRYHQDYEHSAVMDNVRKLQPCTTDAHRLQL